MAYGFVMPATPARFRHLLEEARFHQASRKSPRYPPNLEGLGKAIHLKVNEIRGYYGLPSLHWNNALEEIAKSHSYDMAMRNYFSHVTPEGRTLSHRYAAKGYRRTKKIVENMEVLIYPNLSGENIFFTYLARYFYSDGSIHSYHTRKEILEQIVSGWMASKGHRENILFTHWDYEGIGVAIRIPEGRAYVTQNFS